MCGRYTLRSPAELLRQMFGLPELPGIGPRYNIAPSQPVPTVRHRSGTRTFSTMRWGLIPYWADDAAIGNRMINARSETVASKPAYRDPFRRRRCLLPADGFYEWERLASGRKQPWFLALANDRPFAFAGLWDRWKPPGADREILSCCLLTTEPNEICAPIHDRMPVILTGPSLDTWLDEEASPEALLQLCRPFSDADMKSIPVSVRVNDPANDDAGCLDPVSRPRDAPRLFD